MVVTRFGRMVPAMKTKTNRLLQIVARTFLTCVVTPALTASAGESSEPVQRVVRAPVPASNTNSARPAAGTPTLKEVELPPAPEGVTDLRFNEIYRLPIGPAGLEFTEKVRSLDGKKIRLAGYMVKQSRPMPWTLLLSPIPMTLHESHYGFAEDLPPQTVHAFTERTITPILPHTPGLMLLTGRLELGAREEPDGRVSHVRLFVDPPTPEQRRALATLADKADNQTTNLTEPAAPPAPSRGQSDDGNLRQSDNRKPTPEKP